MGRDTALLVDDYDTARLGFYVTDVSGWADSPAMHQLKASLPGRLGSIVGSSSEVTAEDRVVTVQGVLKASTVAALVTARQQLRDALQGRMVELAFPDDANILAVGFCDQVVFSGVAPQFLNPYYRVSIRVTCIGPYLVSRYGTSVSHTAGAAASPCPVGTGAVGPYLRVWGGNNPTITVKDSTGATLYQLVATITLATGDFLEIDCHNLEVWKTISSVRSAADDVLSAASTFPVLSAKAGDFRVSSWPTIETSVGTLLATYNRTW